MATSCRVARIRRSVAADGGCRRFFTFNQGFYNVFLAAGATAGPVLIAAGHGVVGLTILVYACGSMAAAATVLLAGGGRKYLRAASVQAALPVLALLAALLHAAS